MYEPRGCKYGHTLGRANTDTDTVDEATDHKHANILRRAHNDTANAPDNGTHLNGLLTTKDVGQLIEISNDKRL